MPIRSPLTSAEGGALRDAGCCSSMSAPDGGCCAIASKTILQSRAERVKGPRVSSVRESGIVPSVGIIPRVGFSPVRPVAVAGPLTEPPVSEPSAAKQSPAAVAAAEPLEEVHTQMSSPQGFRGVGRPGPWSVRAASDMRRVPRTMAPADRSRRTTSASCGR